MAARNFQKEASPIAVVKHESSIVDTERDMRLDDYLNDKIQVYADFGSLNQLIANVETQRAQLQTQLQDAKAKLVQSKQAAAEHTEKLLEKTATFQKQQASIEKRLAIVTASDAPEEAVRRFEGPIEKLRRLDLAHYYVELLQEVDKLSNEAQSHLPAYPSESLKPYAKLRQLSLSLQNLQDRAEGAAGHIVTYVDRRADALWQTMQQIMVDDFDSILKKADWPTASAVPTPEWTTSFVRLIDLQKPELVNVTKPTVMLPMIALAKPFVQQFRYHFMGAKPTNSKLHPNYFLEWVVNLIETRQDYLYDNVAPILVSCFADTKLAENSLYVDPVSAFITALLPVVREKIGDLMLQIAREPSVMSNFMAALITFDDEVREKFNYDGGDKKNGWRGLADETLDIWFPKWLQVEKEFALERYQEIVKNPENAKIDYDSAGPKRTKATYGAMKVTDLMATVTKQYQGLKRFQYKLRFLIDIQIAILDEYHAVLHDSFEAYKAATSRLVGTLQGVTAEQQQKVQGISGLESLCKVYGSADHIINTLDDWSNELFFAELWNDLQGRARKTSLDENMIDTMTYSEVKNTTSSAVGSELDGGLFDETILAYRKLHADAQQRIVNAVKYALPATMRNYINKPNWLSLDASQVDDAAMSITAEFEAPLRLVETDMAFLHKALSTVAFRRVWHEVLESMQDSLWGDVLLSQNFTRLGAAQFYRDLSALRQVIDQYVTDGSSSALGMLKLHEALVLLNLPQTKEDAEQRGLPMTFGEALEKVYAGTQQAQEMLEMLGLTTLTHLEARQVMDRRQL